MWVVKIGGSLASDELLACWLDSLSCYGGGEVVIVPGGGRLPSRPVSRNSSGISMIPLYVCGGAVHTFQSNDARIWRSWD